MVSPFVYNGTMARPAGLPRPQAPGGLVICGPSQLDGRAVSAQGIGDEHALRRHSPYAHVAPAGWSAQEAGVQPNQSMRSAGQDLYITNTYTPAPIKGLWGKTRELSVRELQPRPRSQVTDLLSTTKGFSKPPIMDATGMDVVRPPFSPSIPVYRENGFGFEAGFLRRPNVSRGARLAPLSPLATMAQIDPPATMGSSKMSKFSFDKTALGTSRIPVCKAWL